MQLPDRNTLVDIVNEAVTYSNAHRAFRNTSDFEAKSDGTIVTKIDNAIQKEIFDQLRKYNIALIGEESSELNENSHYTAAIDPLDGTEAFLRGIPTSACAVTILEKRNSLWFPIMSVITELTESGDTWSAEEDGPTYVVGNNKNQLAERVCRIRVATKPYMVTVSTWPGVPFNLEQVVQEMKYSEIRNQAFGSIALGGGLIASGCTHGTVFAGKSALETIAMALIVRGAGGVATDVFGNDLGGFELGVNERDNKPDFILPAGAIMASDKAVKDMLVELISL